METLPTLRSGTMATTGVEQIARRASREPETVEENSIFMPSPDQTIERNQIDIVIYTPTAKSGLDIRPVMGFVKSRRIELGRDKHLLSNPDEEKGTWFKAT
jgi:hypothetical protein